LGGGAAAGGAAKGAAGSNPFNGTGPMRSFGNKAGGIQPPDKGEGAGEGTARHPAFGSSGGTGRQAGLAMANLNQDIGLSQSNPNMNGPMSWLSALQGMQQPDDPRKRQFYSPGIMQALLYRLGGGG